MMHQDQRDGTGQDRGLEDLAWMDEGLIGGADRDDLIGDGLVTTVEVKRQEMLAGVVRTLAPVIVQHGIATAEEIDVPTLQQRIADAVADANAVILPPTVSGGWGKRAP